ncbi:hypothetical protein KGQ20_38465 [Catenulispora sp. NF23]|uniref:Uncharacterized protein n=1 Tax=Catenulispora pinistramenti TaxID=2705254 RepID=A0ABS5L6I4_9ACTN|nr:hypothetical protein [Catenulispora pinistramenti]MBS2538648.1 hypothetical protein [Catenulispora pinistramenti]MBS2553948.1 hypothetical protein [Catenulispora pinistramenti]
MNFDAVYHGADPRPARWDERVRLVALIGAFNTLPNAIASGWKTAYADEARQHLRALVAPR